MSILTFEKGSSTLSITTAHSSLFKALAGLKVVRPIPLHSLESVLTIEAGVVPSLEFVVLIFDSGEELIIHSMKARPSYLDLLP